MSTARTAEHQACARPDPARAGSVRCARLCLLPVVAGLILLATASCASRHATSAVPRPSAEQEAAARPDALRRDVALLRSEDFVTRSRAAERLVAAGERALPPLGEAGEGLAPVHRTVPVRTTQPVLREILAELPPERVRCHLQAPWPVIRREAAEELGRRGRWSAIPRLLDSIADPDPEVRASSAAALRRLTNRFFGFQADAVPGLRCQAAERWRDWWTIEGRVRGSKRDGGGAPAGQG